MTEPVRELLDCAVAGVRPRAVDPVGDVVRRYRRRRGRVTAAGISAAVVLLAVGVGVAPPRFVGEDNGPEVVASEGPTEPAVAVQTGPASPRIVGNEIIAGGLVMPIPSGWRTIDDATTIYCDVPPRTIAVGFDPVPGGTGEYCDQKPFITITGASFPAWSLPPRGGIDQRQLTLPGGQPAWLITLPEHDVLGQRPYNVERLYLPWSGVVVGISLDQADFAEIFPMIRTLPVTPSDLLLPDDVTAVQVFGSSDSDPLSNVGPRVTDATVVAKVLQGLRSLTDVVPNDEACATVDMPTIVLQLNAAAEPASIIITRSDRCAQATSSLGGRVTVPRGFTDELWRLLGGKGTVEPAR